MLLKIKFAFFLLGILLFSVIFTSCEKKQQKPVSYAVPPDSALKIDKAILATYAERILGPKVKIFDYGIYQADSSRGLVVGKNIMSDSLFGMKFYYFKLIHNEPRQIYETPLLKGSFNESLVKKIKMINYIYEMIYYDSQDYFMGSGGGEVFTYIIDLNERAIYYAHFFTIPDKPVSLFLPDNIKPEIREFLVKHFQRDYPNLHIVSKDINLENAL